VADPKIRYDIAAQVTGTDDLQALAKAMQGLDDGIPPLLAQRARELQTELERLGRDQGLIDRFREQRTATTQAATAYDTARTAATRLGAEMAQTEAPTRKQVAAFNAARTASKEAETAFQAQRLKLQDLRGQLSASGISTDSLVDAQRRLREQQASVRTEIQSTTDWAGRMATAQRAAGTEANTLAGRTQASAAALRQQGQAAQQTEPQLNKITGTLRNLASVGVAGILGSQTARMLGDVGATADAFANLQARVKLVTGAGAEFTTAWQGVTNVALQTNSNLENTATLFARVAQAGKELGLSQQQSLAVTETINQAVQLSGTSAQASSAAITQLIQGLQSGVLRGEEFNSVMEQSPRLATALAAGIGVTTGELRKLANEGKLTTDVVINALQSQAGVLRAEFGTLPETIGRSLENLSTKWSLFVGNLNSATGATATVAQGINALAENLDELAGIAGRAGAVLVAALAVQGVNALRALATQSLATAGSMAILTTQINKIPTAINIVVAAVGFEIGFQIGEMLRDNSALARQLGVGITAFFANIVNDLQLLAESAKAIFTDDTIGQAFDRYRERGQELDRIFGELWEEAKTTPGLVSAAATESSQALGTMGTAGTAAGAAVQAGGQTAAAGLGSAAQAADTAQGAINALATAATAKLPAVGQAAAAQAAQLQRVVDAGQQAALTFGQQLPDAIAKLAGPELQAFRTTMVGALQDAERAARRTADELTAAGKNGAAELAKADRAAALLQAGLLAVGNQAAKSLGVDMVQASSSVTAEFAAQQENLSTLIATLPALKTAGVNTAQVVRSALSNLIDGAKNAAEVNAVIARFDSLGIAATEAGELIARALDKRTQAATTQAAVEQLRAEYQRLGAQGRITGQQMTDGLAQVQRKIDEITPGINSLEEAASKLGVKLKSELQTAAEDTRRAWEVLRNSTQVGIDQKVAAFQRYREAAIAANGGVESSALQLEAKTLQLAAAAAGVGVSFTKGMGEADRAIESTRSRVRQLASDVASAASGLAGIGNTQPNATKVDTNSVQAIEARLSNKSGGTIGSTFTPPPDNSGDFEWVAPPERPGGMWVLSAAGSAKREAAAKQQLDVLRAAYNQAGLPIPQGGIPTLGLPAAVRQQLNGLPGQFSLNASTPAASPAAAPAPAPSSQAPQVIELRIGTTTAQVSTNNPSAVQALFKQLEQDLARAGVGGSP
jgi:tape measure domain-containing protein